MDTARRLARLLCIAALTTAAAVAAAPEARGAVEAAFTVVGNQTGANAGQNFNGVARGRLTITVAPGTPVHIIFKNDRKAMAPHSFQVVPLKGTATSPALPAQAEPQPVFEGAETPKPGTGTAAGKTADVRFTASKAGRYLFICGFPGHALLGMYGTFDVTPGAKPSMTVKP